MGLHRGKMELWFPASAADLDIVALSQHLVLRLCFRARARAQSNDGARAPARLQPTNQQTNKQTNDSIRFDSIRFDSIRFEHEHEHEHESTKKEPRVAANDKVNSENCADVYN